MFSNTVKQLVKARGFVNENFAIFGELPIIILIEDFY